MPFSRAPDKNLTIAFAGVLQSAMLVRQLARTAHYDSDALHQSTYSLLRLRAASAAEVFGSGRGVRMGLDGVLKFFGGGGAAGAPAREVFHYALGLHHMSAKLRQNRASQKIIEDGLDALSARFIEHYLSQEHDRALQAELAALYVSSMSAMAPRIMVRGSQAQLENPLTINRVRTALFAGIRAAWLWRQLGGRRWHLLLHRQDYRRRAQSLLGGVKA